MRILIVDDDADQADSLAEVLTLLGHATLATYSGPDALARAARFQPDLVILDRAMPRMDGLTAARKLREQLGPGVRIQAYSGCTQASLVQEANEAGCDGILIKPLDPSAWDRVFAGWEARPEARHATHEAGRKAGAIEWDAYVFRPACGHRSPTRLGHCVFCQQELFQRCASSCRRARKLCERARQLELVIRSGPCVQRSTS